MAKQIGIGTFLGSDGGVTGYCDDMGRALIRMKSSLTKAKWKRMPSMAGQREAARHFGAATKIAASVWRNVPREMKRLMDAGAFNRLVGTIRMSQGEDGNVVDFDGLWGLDLNEGSLGELGPSRALRHGFESLSRSAQCNTSGSELEIPRGPRKRDTADKLRDSRVAGLDEGLKMKDERSVAGGRAGRALPVRYEMAQRFIGAGLVQCAPTDENLGSMADLRAGLAALRAERASQGEPVRRMRTWTCLCEVGTVECAGKGQSGRFLLVQRGTNRLGRGWRVSEWERLDADFQDHKLGEGFRPWGIDTRSLANGQPELHRNEVAYEGLLREGFASSAGSGVYLVIEATEVAEKRGRHWVRLPFACHARVVDVVERELGDIVDEAEQIVDGEESIMPRKAENSGEVADRTGEHRLRDLDWMGMVVEMKGNFCNRLTLYRVLAGVCVLPRGQPGRDGWVAGSSHFEMVLVADPDTG